MPLTILSPQVQEFILENTNTDVTKLALQKNPFPDVEWTEVLNQIAARQKAKDKLPTWYESSNIIYPSKVSVEQTSSEITSQYKASLVSGESLIDLTGGFGVDDYYFAKTVSKVAHCEMNEQLSQIVAHNISNMGVSNIQCYTGDSLKTLTELKQQWDWIYIDPSRRSDVKGKVFMLKDCLPNVPELLDTYFNYSSNILIKTAPLLDIAAGLGELHSVKEIYITALNNEVKELLWHLEKGFTGIPVIHAVNLSKDGEPEVFTTTVEDEPDASYSLPLSYLYEPNSAIMKSGAFNDVAKQFNLYKLHRHTQLYTSDTLIDFPGRKFIINEIVSYGKTEMKKHATGQKMNITVRNFPISVEEIRKKWKIKDGGVTYAFFTTDKDNNKLMLICSKA
ncbi:class I SAM-dependent methyltransferase [Flavobacterium rakeshii]|uniref:Class I SAM-dependent methyltransferase n=1 Tax=Flavobacterium rakeshii TaxID=1038845 RepID=A0A6N8HBN9_9FLAO|nr:class I SAM-dependent methyltransferase [Flavobacterium rakeshii]MUV03881.1 class I SAM-dependent methyltransferase [Flavobacterium rakeshii]